SRYRPEANAAAGRYPILAGGALKVAFRLAGGVQKILKKPADFASLAQIRCGRVGGAKKKWTTSSRRENCRSSASISMWSSVRTTVGNSCASLKKLTAAVTASSCRVPVSMLLRRRLLEF